MSAMDDPTAAFTRLWTKHQGSVFAYIHSLVPNWADAEDVLQETGAVLWKKYGQFDPQSDFRRWACGVAYYEVLKQRERMMLKPRFSEAFLALLAKRSLGMLDTVSPLHEGLARCIETLSLSDRQLLTLRYTVNATVNHIAAQLHRSSDGVRKSLRRIHHTLFECVERWRRQEEHV